MLIINSDNTLTKIVGENLKKYRLEKGMTQQDIANELTKLKKNNTPITRATISKYENGKLNVSIENVLDIANILNVPIKYIFGNNTEIYNDDNGYSIDILNFDMNKFDKLDKKTKNKIIDDAIRELNKLKKEIENDK